MKKFIKRKPLKQTSPVQKNKTKKKGIIAFVLLFAVIGASYLIYTKAAVSPSCLDASGRWLCGVGGGTPTSPGRMAASPTIPFGAGLYSADDSGVDAWVGRRLNFKSTFQSPIELIGNDGSTESKKWSYFKRQKAIHTAKPSSQKVIVITSTWLDAGLTAAKKPDKNVLALASSYNEGENVNLLDRCNSNADNGLRPRFRNIATKMKEHGYHVPYAAGHPLAGRPKVIFRMGHEANGTWFIWNYGTGTGTAQKFKQCWQNIVSDMRTIAGNGFGFDWSVTPAFTPTSTLQNAFPGANNVDVLDISWHGKYGIVPCAPRGQASQPNSVIKTQFDNDFNNTPGMGTFKWLADFAKSQGDAAGKRILVGSAEWGIGYQIQGTNGSGQTLCEGGGDDAHYIKLTYDMLKNNSDQPGEMLNNRYAYFIEFESVNLLNTPTNTSIVQQFTKILPLPKPYASYGIDLAKMKIDPVKVVATGAEPGDGSLTGDPPKDRALLERILKRSELTYCKTDSSIFPNASLMWLETFGGANCP